MVNRGRPSRDCLPCRRRKLQCDLRPEGCGQCRRARLMCQGYRDASDLLFRDETRSVENKVVARQMARHHHPQPTSLELGLDARARHIFFSLYVFGFSRSLGAIAPLSRSAPVFGHLAATVDATSLAFLVTHLNNMELVRLANQSYLMATRSLSRALAGLKSGGAPEALQSILLLDMYEKMINRNPQGSTSWMIHTQGGISLVETFGSDIALGVAGRDLCARLVTAVVVSCGAAVVRVPDALRTLRGRLDPFYNTVKWRFMGILISIVNLQADLHRAGGISTMDMASRAQQLDIQLARLQETVPLPWRPRTISPVRDHPLIFGTYYDVFADHYVTQVTNGIRAMRLVLHQILSRHSSGNDSSLKIRDITHQICASVPQFILPWARSTQTVPFSPLQRLQCCTLLAPLYIANQVSEDAYMRDWIRGCLEHMAEKGGMKMAQDMVDLTRTNRGLDYWRVYATVGSYAFAA